MKTLNGFLVSELTTLLDQPLPPQAYKALPGGADLTDIDAGWQRRAFNKIFGIYGIGWGFNFTHDHIDIRHEENKSGKVVPYAKVYGNFWFAYVDAEGRQRCASFPVTGANSNQTGNEGYTLKGAITNAIGFGASMLGWQESVYLGARSHRNTEGFAEGKGYAETDQPAEVAPAPAPAPAPVPAKAEKPPVVLTVSYCPDCLKIIQQAGVPGVCKCGGKNIKETTDIDAARRAVNKLMEARKPVPTAQTKAPEPPVQIDEPAAKDPEKTLAENIGFESIKYAVCVHCGFCEPVNTLPEACSACGVVAPWSVAKTHALMLEMSANIRGKNDISKGAAKSKEVLEALKVRFGNNRGLLLQALSDATGRKVSGYSECNIDEMQKALDAAPPVGTVAPVGDPASKLSKVELSRMVFEAAKPLNLGGPRSIISEVGKVAGKNITSTNQLNETELLAVLRDFQGRVA